MDAATKATGPAVAELAPVGVSEPPSLRDVLEPLLSVPDTEQKYGCRALLRSLEQLECVQQRLMNRSSPDTETIADQDR